MSAHSVYLKEIKGEGVKYIKVVSVLDVGLNIVEGGQLKRALVVGLNVYNEGKLFYFQHFWSTSFKGNHSFE